MMCMGVQHVPSEHTMKDIDRVLQKICGVQSLRFAGALGHVYYTNDFAAIIAQVNSCYLGSKYSHLLTIVLLRSSLILESDLILLSYPRTQVIGSARLGKRTVG